MFNLSTLSLCTKIDVFSAKLEKEIWWYNSYRIDFNSEFINMILFVDVRSIPNWLLHSCLIFNFHYHIIYFCGCSSKTCVKSVKFYLIKNWWSNWCDNMELVSFFFCYTCTHKVWCQCDIFLNPTFLTSILKTKPVIFIFTYVFLWAVGASHDDLTRSDINLTATHKRVIRFVITMNLLQALWLQACFPVRWYIRLPVYRMSCCNNSYDLYIYIVFIKCEQLIIYAFINKIIYQHLLLNRWWHFFFFFRFYFDISFAVAT